MGELSYTADTIAAELIALFRLTPGRPIYSSGGRLRPAFPGETDGRLRRALDMVEHVNRLLADDPEGRYDLLLWARAKARTGPSVSELCRAYGWCRKGFCRRRKAALARLVARLNAERQEAA